MPSNFPSSPDDIQNDVANSTLAVDTHPNLHNQLADAVMAVQTELLAGGSMSHLTMYHQEFTPAASATTVTLSGVPETVLIVSREGVVQSAVGGHYSVAGNVLTFGASFSGTERVIVSYSVRA